MKVYVAGKTQDWRRVRLLQELVRSTEHEITHDWTAIIEGNGGDSNEIALPPEDRQRYARWDMEGVRSCDLLIALGHPQLSGTLWECGAAASREIPVWLVWWTLYGRRSIFEDLPWVEHVGVRELAQRLQDANDQAAFLPSQVRGWDKSSLG